MKRMIFGMVAIFGAVVLAGCAINCCCNNQSAKAKKVLNFSMEPAKVFEASTENGSVDLTGSPEAVCKIVAEVEVRAASQEKADEYVHKVYVLFERTENLLKATVDRREVPKEVSVGVSYKVSLPAATELKLSSVNGHLTACGITGAVEARTVNGSVETEGQAGNVKASTVNGSMKLKFAADAKVDTIQGSTVNGSAAVNLPRSFGGSVRLSTVNGGISSDVELTVKGKLGKSVNARIGTGTGNLELSTVNGSISVGQL